jgi:hypothetical protein
MLFRYPTLQRLAISIRLLAAFLSSPALSSLVILNEVKNIGAVGVYLFFPSSSTTYLGFTHLDLLGVNGTRCSGQDAEYDRGRKSCYDKLTYGGLHPPY